MNFVELFYSINGELGGHLAKGMGKKLEWNEDINECCKSTKALLLNPIDSLKDCSLVKTYFTLVTHFLLRKKMKLGKENMVFYVVRLNVCLIQANCKKEYVNKHGYAQDDVFVHITFSSTLFPPPSYLSLSVV